MEQNQKETLLPRKEVERRVGHSCSWIYAKVAEGSFPAPIHLSGTSSVRWLETEIDAYIKSQVEQNEDARKTQDFTPAHASTGATVQPSVRNYAGPSRLGRQRRVAGAGKDRA